MKSTALKEKSSIPIKKYLLLYTVLFLVAVVTLVEHYNEDPVTLEQVRSEAEQKPSGEGDTGYVAPDFALRNLKGNWEKLSAYNGQVVILNLWATWCGPCRIEMPSIEELYRKYRAQGLTVLAVSLDKGNSATVKQFVQEYQLSFPVLLDKEGLVERLYPTFTIPATFIIDKKGVVVARVDGAKNWSSDETFDAVEFLLKQS